MRKSLSDTRLPYSFYGIGNIHVSSLLQYIHIFSHPFSPIHLPGTHLLAAASRAYVTYISRRLRVNEQPDRNSVSRFPFKYRVLLQ